jgi:hypothetical protein
LGSRQSTTSAVIGFVCSEYSASQRRLPSPQTRTLPSRPALTIASAVSATALTAPACAVAIDQT